MKRSWIKSAFMVLLVVVLIGCSGWNAAQAASMTVFHFMDSYTEGENLEILWYAVDGADHYECTIKCDSTYLRNRAPTDSYYACYLDGSRVKAGSYKVWVGAIDANGNTIADSIITFTVNEKEECEHRWDDDTGTCRWCDEECPHNNGYYEVTDDHSAKSISDTQHRITEEYHTECKICRYVVESDLKKTSTGKHSFDKNGDCELCDYRAACKHTEKELVPHEPTYSQYDETYHKKRVVSDLVCANANCGKVVAYGDDIKDTKQKHTMVDDRCKYCGYTVEYEDVTVTVSVDNGSGYVGQGIGATCVPKGGTGNYSYAWYVYCDGAEVYSSTAWEKHATYSPTRVGTYTFTVYVTDRKNGDSDSATSGGIRVTVAPCSHTQTSKIYKAGEDTYTKLSDSKHTVEKYYDVVCDACGEVVNTIKETQSEDHTYSGSNCTRCGAARPEEICQHPGKTSTKLESNPWKTDSDVYHYVDITWKDVCSACGITLNTTRTTTEREDHIYSGNTCTICGYIRIVHCDHADKHREAIGSETVCVDDQRHKVTTTYRVTCASCGELLDGALKEDAYFAHTVVDGQCSHCSYTAPVVCEHADKHREAIGSETVCVDDQQHKVITTYRVTCASCGELLDGALKEEACFAHTVVDGQCSYCSYIAPVVCAHANENRVSQGSETKQENAEVHVVITTYSITCADCGAVLNNAHTEQAYFAHTMENGACRYCGYTAVENCTHEMTIRTGEQTAIERNYGDDARTHYAVKTWTASCACGAMSEVKSERVAVEHRYDYHSYEAAHFHKLFDRCECGVVRYPGGYHTVNGTVYDEAQVPDDSECCVCLGHRWLEDEPFQHEGKWQVICSNCGKLREVEAPVGADCSHRLDESALVEVVDLYQVNNVNDPDAHNVVRQWHSEGNCVLCGKRLAVGYCHVGEMVPHQFDAQGTCADCGYVAVTEQYDFRERYKMYIATDYVASDNSITYIGVNEYKTVMVYDRFQDEYLRAANAGLELRLKDDGGIARLNGDVVSASNCGVFTLELYCLDVKLDEMDVGVTMLSVEDTFFEYNYTSSGVVRMEDLNSIDWDDCNVLLTGNVSIGEYTETKNSNGSRTVSFNAYNSSSVVIGVAVYDANGKQVSIEMIESYWGTGSFVEDAYRNFAATVRVWDSKSFNGQNTKVTPVKLTVPAGGSIRVMEMHEDSAVFAANIAEGLLGTVKYYNDVESMVNPVNLKEMEALLESLGKGEYYAATYNYLVRHYGHDFVDLLIGVGELGEEAVDMSMVLETLLSGEDDFVGEILGSIPGAVGSLAVDKTEDALLAFVPGMYHAKHGFQLAHDTIGMYQLFDAYESCMLNDENGKIVSLIIVPQKEAVSPDRQNNSAMADTRYVITTRDTELRNEPSMQYAYYASIPAGSELELLGSETDRNGNLFYKVRYGYSTGYILASVSNVMDFGYESTQKHDSLTDSDVKRRNVRVTHDANLRAKPDGAADYVQRVFVGTVLEYYGEESGWYKVKSPGGGYAYIFAQYAEVQ